MQKRSGPGISCFVFRIFLLGKNPDGGKIKPQSTPVFHFSSPVFLYLLSLVLLFLLLPTGTFASPTLPISGQLRFTGTVSDVEPDSLLGVFEEGNYFDGQADLRLMNTHYFSDRVYLVTHYEAVTAGGDTREQTNELLDLIGTSGPAIIFRDYPIEDDRRLMDLTHIVSDENGRIAYHRLDRLALGIRYKRGAVIIGRQAQTWGNGLIFNPMDLFNPFAPTDIRRDYKIGDDMISASFSTGRLGDVQVLAVPRRDLEHDIRWDASSLAAKWHVSRGTLELDFMGARHYDDYVVGLGGAGYLGNAAWRMDGTWTFLKDDPNAFEEDDGFFTFVANMDYSWVWGGKNFYGFLEFHHNGLGRTDYIEAFFDMNVLERLERGEIFTLGRYYLSGLVQFEIHPLVNLFCTVIENLEDPSGVVLPRLLWNAKQNLQITLGASIFTGGTDTEFGGIGIPFTPVYLKSANNAFVWVTWYF
ncbi:MAG: hypothetical protein R6U50_17455 [Desulfobacterales bacterium]